MRLTNFSIDSSIELGFGDQERFLDLHNIYDFRSIQYLQEERRIDLAWSRGTGDRVNRSLPGQLVLTFSAVTKFALNPRDPDMPYSEDSCLAFLTFSPPDFSLDFQAQFPGYRGNCEHLTFGFQSGLAFKIWAEEAQLALL